MHNADRILRNVDRFSVSSAVVIDIYVDRIGVPVYNTTYAHRKDVKRAVFVKLDVRIDWYQNRRPVFQHRVYEFVDQTVGCLIYVSHERKTFV